MAGLYEMFALSNYVSPSWLVDTSIGALWGAEVDFFVEVFFPGVSSVPVVVCVIGGAVSGSTAIANAKVVTAKNRQVLYSVGMLNESPGQVCWVGARSYKPIEKLGDDFRFTVEVNIE